MKKKKKYIQGAISHHFVDNKHIKLTDRHELAMKFSNTENIIERLENIICRELFSQRSWEGSKTFDIDALRVFVNECKDLRVVFYKPVPSKQTIDETIKNLNFVNCNLHKEIKAISNFAVNQHTYNQDIAWLFHYISVTNPKKFKKFIIHIKGANYSKYLSSSEIDLIKETLGKDAVYSDNVSFIKNIRGRDLISNYYIATDNETDANLLKLALNISELEMLETKKLDWFS